MTLLKNFMAFLKPNTKEIIKHFFNEELNDINNELLEAYKNIRDLEKKRDKLELFVFGN